LRFTEVEYIDLVINQNKIWQSN